MADVKSRIIDSVFSRRSAGGNLAETYVSHVKIYEETDGGSRKARYILLSRSESGSGFIHKSKANSNGTFSVGKTWRLQELKGIQVVNSICFNISLSRTYKWDTDSAEEQKVFIHAMIQLFRQISNDPLQLDGVEGYEHGRQRIQQPQPQPAAHPALLRPRGPGPTRTPSPTSNGQAPAAVTPSRASPHPSRHPRNRDDAQSAMSSRAPSPAQSQASRTRMREPSVPRRPASPARSQASSAAPSRLRSGSIGSSTMRGSVASSSTTTLPPPPSAPPSVYAPSPAPPPSRGAPSPVPSSVRSSPNIPRTLPSNLSSTSLESRAQPQSQPQPMSPQPEYEAPQPPVQSNARSRKQPTRGATMFETAKGPDKNARISFYDTANQADIDRLVGTTNDVEGDAEEENTQATMASVEEMMEGYEWASGDVIGRKTGRGAAELIEARLLDELMALEKANIHSFLESDDRIGVVLKFIDDAMADLDGMGSLVSTYKIHLNAVGDDISYIQSQNRGLQVQTQNQKALIAEIENLLNTVQVDQEALMTLNNAQSLDKDLTIQRLEEAGAELYKALIAGRDSDMGAMMERLQEYLTHNAQFCKRIFDFLSIMFTAQAKMLLGDTEGLSLKEKRRPTMVSHREMEAYLGRYSGLLLYLKEMEENVYSKLCATYFSAANELNGAQIRALMNVYAKYVKSGDEEQDGSFGPNGQTARPSGLKRAGTLINRKEKNEKSDGNLRVAEVLEMILGQIAPMIVHENDFIADFLAISDSTITFADYMNLDTYFRRQAARGAGLSQGTLKLVRGALDLIFSFLPQELKAWIDTALAKDRMQIFGVVACIERFIGDADERGNHFFIELLSKQHSRLKGLLDRHIGEQISSVEQTKVTSKKRGGIVPFVKHFPVYIASVEEQLIGYDDLDIRAYVGTAYENIVQAMFESLKQMAKLGHDGDGEDKGQLNYHVILVENMHHFVSETSRMEVGTQSTFLQNAEAIYDENLNAYVKIVLRRPFARIIDYFEGVERMLKTTSPNEVATNSSYNRHQLKKVVREYNSKDIKKNVDALFKRVEKHFTEEKASDESRGIVAGTVMVGVWKACEEELLRITELFAKRIVQCYPDSGVGLEYTPADVEAAFKRHRGSG
ncbi:hypothetical protein CYLTODRAFT_371472 [Cylindrobasidium torrendii FP15055 ss-10]|uniref:Exocyst complex component Sec3 PIP2-binding N-terminal domain-containing protein n=1 Tax=Cylindrobasidium torrendii FP15055 ss-10 TaxID=1314674 RepID=A0A0D7BJD1_9AGAR|nr:hypothetical protein CYLTODRAFT_371472 [Cylindrobasidium torrendii FP15055 ss-10]